MVSGDRCTNENCVACKIDEISSSPRDGEIIATKHVKRPAEDLDPPAGICEDKEPDEEIDRTPESDDLVFGPATLYVAHFGATPDVDVSFAAGSWERLDGPWAAIKRFFRRIRR